LSSVGSFFSYVNDARSQEPKHPNIIWSGTQITKLSAIQSSQTPLTSSL